MSLGLATAGVYGGGRGQVIRVHNIVGVVRQSRIVGVIRQGA